MTNSINSVVKVVRGAMRILGGTDGTPIGNVADALKVTGGAGGLPVTPADKSGVVSSLSTDIPLSAGGDFTPPFSSVEQLEGITVLINGTTNAAPGTLFMEFSADGTVADRTITIAVGDLTDTLPRTLGIIAEFFRVRYVNGGTNQTTFELQTIAHKSKVELTSRLDQTIQGDEDVKNTRSAIMGDDAGTWRNIGATPTNDLKVKAKDTSGTVASLSTTTPLGISASFTPAFVSVEQFEGIAILINGTTAAATGTLFLDFSADGVTTDRTVTIVVEDLTTAPPRTSGVISEFFRVRYVNNGTAQTTFVLQTTFHKSEVELISKLNQALVGNEDVKNVRAVLAGEDVDGVFQNIKSTLSGHLGVGLFDPETGVPGLVTPAGALKVSEIAAIAGDVFGMGPLATNKWRTSTANGGTLLETLGELIVDTNGVADATAALDSIQKGRFYAGHFNTGHLAAQLSSVWASADTVAEWGAYDATNVVDGNGIFIRYTGGEFNIVTRRDGVETVVNEADFNVFIPAKTDLTTVWEIGYNAGTARFFQGTRVFHVESARAGPYVATPHLRVGARIYNLNGSAEAHDIRFRALGIYRVGRPFAVPEKTAITSSGITVIKDSPGTLHRIVVSRTGGGGAGATVTLRDGTLVSDPVISVISMSGNENQSHEFLTTFNDGLSVDLSTAQFDVTVIWD